jgi:MinD superfamily P-loop ATPase
MVVAVASGKGGTEKTSVAVSLALSLAPDPGAGRGSPTSPLLVDCDVEEPSVGLFLRPVLSASRVVGQQIPEVDRQACTRCGRCAEVCQYHAVAAVGDSILVFPKLCHGCGSCRLECPVGAMKEVCQRVGSTERSWGRCIEFAHGLLRLMAQLARRGNAAPDAC